MATGTEVLDAGRATMCVLFYRDEQELTERVSEYLLPAVQDGGVAIVVATPDHRRSFERHLADAGVDVAAPAPAAVPRGDASETMRGFMVADWPIPVVSGRRSAPCSGRRPRLGSQFASSARWSRCSGMPA